MGTGKGPHFSLYTLAYDKIYRVYNLIRDPINGPSKTFEGI